MVAKHTIANTVPYANGMRFKRENGNMGIIINRCECSAPWGLHYEVQMDNMAYIMCANHAEIIPIVPQMFHNLPMEPV